MRVTVFGATGGTGREVARQALDAGHEVTAVARDPAKMDDLIGGTREGLRVVRGDAFDPPSVAAAIAGADAVVSALGTTIRRSQPVCSTGTGHIVTAMRAEGVRRLVVVSAAPIAPHHDADTLPYRLVVKRVLWAVMRAAYEDMARMEDVVRASDLDWTIMRPPRLTDGRRTGRYRRAPHATVRRGYQLSRADLADAILRSLEDRDAVAAAVGVAY